MKYKITTINLLIQILDVLNEEIKLYENDSEEYKNLFELLEFTNEILLEIVGDKKKRS